MPVKKEIIYPIFLECVQYTSDEFWKQVFEELAYGKVPYGCYISKDFICCNFKGKEFSYKVEKKDPQIIYNDVYNLFNNRLGILSDSDKTRKIKDFERVENEIKEVRNSSWSSIKKKSTKDFIIENYVVEMKHKFSLNSTQAKILMSLVIMGIMFKSILSSDITYEDGKITKINGIDFLPKKMLLTKNFKDVNVSEPTIEFEIKKCLSDYWKKYCETTY